MPFLRLRLRLRLGFVVLSSPVPASSSSMSSMRGLGGLRTLFCFLFRLRTFSGEGVIDEAGVAFERLEERGAVVANPRAGTGEREEDEDEDEDCRDGVLRLEPEGTRAGVTRFESAEEAAEERRVGGIGPKMR